MKSIVIFINLTALLFFELSIYIRDGGAVLALDMVHVLLDIMLFALSFYVVFKLKSDAPCQNRILKIKSQLTVVLIIANIILYFGYLIYLLNRIYRYFASPVDGDYRHVSVGSSLTILAFEVLLYLLSYIFVEEGALKRVIQIDLLFDIITGISLLFLSFVSFFTDKLALFDGITATMLLCFIVFPKLISMLIKTISKQEAEKSSLESILQSRLIKFDDNIVGVHNLQISHIDNNRHKLKLHLVGKNTYVLYKIFDKLLSTISTTLSISKDNISISIESKDSKKCRYLNSNPCM